VHPEVAEAMREIGIDLSGARPRKLTDEVARTAQMLVTMGCGDQCPFVPGVRTEDWQLTDPKGQPIEAVRRIRDRIHALVTDLIGREGVGRGS
jgi:arsenate reductase